MTPLQTEISVFLKEVQKLQAERDALYQKRSSFRIDVAFPKSASPEDLAQFKRQSAEVSAKWSEELQKLDQALQVLDAQLSKKRAVLEEKQAQQHWIDLEKGIHVGGQKLQQQAEKVNQIATQLEAEVKALKELYKEFNPIYCEWLQRQVEIIKFSTHTVPFVVAKDNYFELIAKEVK